MATTFKEVGVRYCVQHHGIANEDDTECDYKRSDWGRWNGTTEEAPFPCKFRTLGYFKATR